MGIPGLYKWVVDTHPLAVDTNPNGVEFDNLYLDMNGIIHPCFHPQHQHIPAPTSYEEVFKAVFKYIDKIFSLIRPRKLIYLAIDGVAPRAKMNHQRSRRFRTAKDASEEASREGNAEEDKRAEAANVTRLEQDNKLDSNVITPGTEFMTLLSSALQYYVHLKMNGDPGWKDIKVIVSDASVPGEGEHKIMAYIRLQRNLPGFDPNTRHCLYGLDADLIMLALASHEIHFSILREIVSKPPEGTISKKDRSKSRGKGGNRSYNLKKLYVESIEDYISKQEFQFYHVWVLRDYLMHELRIPDRTVKTDLERLIDDFVFMCIFVGNDFLPHMPSLQIFEGAIDFLINVYKNEFIRMGGYLTDSWKVNLKRVQHFVQAVGSYENAIFQKRSQVVKQMDMRESSTHSRLKKIDGSINNSTGDVVPVIDQIRLGEAGWKERYYVEKFEAKTDDERERIRKHAVLKYVEGICWFMHYYYEGVCSWQWFYPYHYAPFASDLYGLDKLQIEFTLGMPFKPFEQLMAVFPAASAHALPFSYRKLMTDPSSPILDFYPNDFELDLNGRHFSWQAICKLPFINESRLLSELAKVEHTLTDEEKHRNSLGLDLLFVHKIHPLAGKIFSFCMKSKNHPKLHEAKVKQKINPKASGGMNGYMYISDKLVSPLEIESPVKGLPRINQNGVMSVFYKYPSFHSHIPRPPEGVSMPSKSVSKKNVFTAPVLWHEKSSLPGRVTRDRRTTKFVSNHRVAISAHRLVSMLQTKGRLRVTDCTSIDVVEGGQSNEACAKPSAVDNMAPVPNQKATASEMEISGEGKNSGITGLPNEACAKPSGVDDVESVPYQASEKIINAEMNEPDAIPSRKRKHKGRQSKKALVNRTNLDDMAPVPDQKATTFFEKVNREGKESCVVSLSHEACAKHTGVNAGEIISNQNSTAYEKEVNGGGKESNAIASKKRKCRKSRSEKALHKLTSVDDMAPVSDQKSTAVVEEVNRKGKESGVVGPSNKACAKHTGVGDSGTNQNSTAFEKEVNGEGKESDAIASKKRKCRKSRYEKALAKLAKLYDVETVSDQKATAVIEEVNREGKESGVVGLSNETCAKYTGVDDGETNQNSTAFEKEVNGEGKESDAIAFKKRKRTKGQFKKARVDNIGLDDVAHVPNQKPTASVKEVNVVADVASVPKKPTALVKEVNGEAIVRGNLSGIADVASVPNQKPTVSVKEVNGEAIGEGKVYVVAEGTSNPNQKPTASVKEVTGEGNLSCVADVASIPNQKPTTLVSTCVSVA